MAGCIDSISDILYVNEITSLLAASVHMQILSFANPFHKGRDYAAFTNRALTGSIDISES
ncbi:hypothetical protein D3C74_326430 [compost metagenome]